MIGMINAYHIDTPYIKRLRWLQDGMIKLIVSSIAICAGIMFLIFMVMRPCIADFNYEQGTLLQAVDGMEEQTIYRFKRAVEFNPHEIQYMREVAAYYIHKAQKNPEEKIIRNAIQASERLIKFNPYDVVGHCIIGAGYYLLGSKLMGKDTELLDKALSSYRKAIQVDPLNPDPHNCKGLVHLELEEYSKAIQEFKQALKVDIGYAIAIGNLHRTYLKLGKFQEAIDTYRNLIKIDPEVRSILLREKLVDIYIRLGRINDAIEECKIIKQFEPENKVAQRILSLYG
jgi:tetratricopeptide (TPR) repeat protein